MVVHDDAVLHVETGRPWPADHRGQTPIPTTIRSATKVSSGLGFDRNAAIRQGAHTGDRDAEPDVDPMRGMVRLDQGRGFLVADARQDARCDLEHGRLDAELGRRGGHFEADQSGSDHEQRTAALSCSRSASASRSWRR